MISALLFLLAVCSQSSIAANFDLIKPKRMADSKLQLPAEWQKCEQTSDCVWIDYGCGGNLSVNLKFEELGRKKAYDVGGDPRIIDCASPIPDPKAGPSEVICSEKKCGIFQYPKCLDDSCQEKIPTCRYSSKYFMDPKNEDTYGKAESDVWGPTKESCGKKCEEGIRRLRARITHPDQGVYRIECKFEGGLIMNDAIKGAAFGPGF